MLPEMYYFQKQAVDLSMERVTTTEERDLIKIPTGCGKTRVPAEIYKRLKPDNPTCLFTAHRDFLLTQAVGEFKAVNDGFKDYGLFDAHHKQNDRPFVFGMRDSLHQNALEKYFSREAFDFLFIDECFVAGTLINNKPIFNIKVGDLVKSYNHKTNRIELKEVEYVFKNKITNLIEVEFNIGDPIYCTPSHPFWDGNKYKPISEFKRGEYVYIEKNITFNMPKLWKRSYMPKHCFWLSALFFLDTVSNYWKGLLLRGMCKTVYKKNQLKNNEQNKSKTKGYNLTKNERIKSNGERRDKNEKLGDAKEDRPQTQNTGWKRKTNVCPTIFVVREIKKRVSRLASRIGNTYKYMEKWISNKLQNRYWEYLFNDRDRSGRGKSLFIKEKRAGLKKRKIINTKRVDDIEIQEQRNRGRSGEMFSDGYVYNIQVKDNNNYFANGILVHNCHHAHTESKLYSGILNYFNKAKVYGYTATPYTNRGSLSELWNVLLTVQYRDMIRQGFLCPAAVIRLKTNCDLSEVRKSDTSEDGFNKKDLEKIINVHKRNKLVVEAYNQYLNGKTCIVYALNKEHATNLAKEFNDSGVKAELILEDTPQELRNSIRDRLDNKQTLVVINCTILTEGFNVPNLQSILIARPIGSLTLLLQIVGRVLRKHITKDFARILFIADKPGKHKLFFIKDIDDGIPEMDAEVDEERKARVLSEEIENKWLTVIKDAKIIEVVHEDIFRGEKYIWVKDTNTGIFTTTIDKNRKATLRQNTNGSFVAEYHEIIDVLEDIEWAQSRAESYLSTNLPYTMDKIEKDTLKGKKTRSDTISRKQLLSLASHFNLDEGSIRFLTIGQAGKLMALMKNKGIPFWQKKKKAKELIDEWRVIYNENLPLK